MIIDIDITCFFEPTVNIVSDSAIPVYVAMYVASCTLSRLNVVWGAYMHGCTFSILSQG